MKKLYPSIILSLFLTVKGFTQSTIISPGGTIESIKVSGSKNGLVLSGLTTEQRDSIQNPAKGYLIYNITNNCLEFYNGSYWHNLCSNPNSNLTNGLVAYYPFNGNANDVGGNNLNGEVNGAVLTTDRFGNPNKAYSFNTNQDITIPNSSSKNTFPLTISLWYLVDTISTGDNGNIFSKYIPSAYNGFLIHVLEDYGSLGPATVPWYIRDMGNRLLGDYGQPTFLQPNVKFKTWYHFVFIVNQTEGRIYINGNLIDTHPWTGTAGSSTNDFLWKIGGLYNGWFHGKIDDIGIWDRILTPQEITYLYQNQFKP